MILEGQSLDHKNFHNYLHYKSLDRQFILPQLSYVLLVYGQGEIGRGKFGTVYHVVGKEDGASYASKHVKIRNQEQRQKVNNFHLMY